MTENIQPHTNDEDYWKKGDLKTRIKRDLIPFIAAGVFAGLVTAESIVDLVDRLRNNRRQDTLDTGDDYPHIDQDLI